MGSDVLDAVGLTGVMSRVRGDPAVAVALLDGPVDGTHPGFVGIPACGCQGTHDAACRHGTRMAGLLAGDRDVGTTGICPGCRLLVLPVFGGERREATTRDVARGIRDAVAAGARIVNVSGAHGGRPRGDLADLSRALDLAAGHGVLVVVAAGNGGRIGGGSPLVTHPWVIPVTASDLTGRPLPGANLTPASARRGIAAPGVEMVTLEPGGGTAVTGGSSAATAVVTGALALTWSTRPNAPSPILRKAIFGTGSRRTLMPPMLDAARMYAALSALPLGVTG